MIVDTINWVLKILAPLPAVMIAEPMISPIFMFTMSNAPSLEVNREVDISGSLGSWLAEIVRSVKLSQFVLEIVTDTVGVKAIQGSFPVFPPTQFPQLSKVADPFTSPLQSYVVCPYR